MKHTFPSKVYKLFISKESPKPPFFPLNLKILKGQSILQSKPNQTRPLAEYVIRQNCHGNNKWPLVFCYLSSNTIEWRVQFMLKWWDLGLCILEKHSTTDSLYHIPHPFTFVVNVQQKHIHNKRTFYEWTALCICFVIVDKLLAL